MTAREGIQTTGFPRRTACEAEWAPYAALATGERRRLAEHVVPAEEGRAFPVAKGQILRITCPEGPQVCDFNAFAAEDPTEHFWSGRTRTLEGAHLSTGNRLWSTEPRMRPMFTIITDTVPHPKLPGNADSHDLIFARCSRSAWELRFGPGEHPNCNDNLIRGLKKIGYPTTHVHDAFNIFMTTGVDENQRLTIFDPVARSGDHVELVAEMDTIVALSACPGDCNGGRNKLLLAEVFRALES